MILFALGLLACNDAGTTQSPAPQAEVPGSFDATGDVVATVNGNKVTQPMVDTIYEGLPPQVKMQIDAMGTKGPLVEQVIDLELLYRDALKRGVHTKPETKANIAMATRKAMADMALQQAVEEQLTDEAMKKWYDEHQVQFAQEQVKLNHIVAADEKAAQAAMAEIEGGKSFADVAKATSLDQGSAAKGGELGWFSKKDLGGPLGEAAFDAKEGKATGPVKTQYGYHVILVSETRDKAPFDEVKDQIKEQMGSDLAMDYIKGLREGATIDKAEGVSGPPKMPAGALPMPGGDPSALRKPMGSTPPSKASRESADGAAEASGE